MKKNSSVYGIKLYIWPFLIQIDTFGKWLRLSAKSLLSKTEKTQDIWANSDNLSPLEPLVSGKQVPSSGKGGDIIKQFPLSDKTGLLSRSTVASRLWVKVYWGGFSCGFWSIQAAWLQPVHCGSNSTGIVDSSHWHPLISMPWLKNLLKIGPKTVFLRQKTLFSANVLASRRPLRGGGYPPFPLRNFC